MENWTAENRTITVFATSQATPYLMRNRLVKYGFQIEHVTSATEFSSPDYKTRPRLVVIEATPFMKEQAIIDFVLFYQRTIGSCQFALVYNGIPSFEPKAVYTSGIQNTFQLPFEEEVFFDKVFELYSDLEIPPENLELDALTRVFMPEVTSLSQLPFDVFVFLPRNNKVIRYGKKGRPVDNRILEKFGEEGKAKPLYVRKTELNTYREHNAEKLSAIYDDPKMAEHEKKIKLKKELTGFISGVFKQKELSDTESQAMLSMVRQTTLSYLKKTTTSEEIFDRIEALASECASNFNHSINTGMYGALFGLLMGYTNSSDFVMAGLLHDIGLSLIQPDNLNKKEEDRTPTEKREYQQHPLFSVEMIQSRKIPVSSMARIMIEQHHELPDGTGYPKGLKNEELHDLARICAIADLFDELTSVRAGEVLYSPADAIEKIAGIGETESPLAGFDMEIHKGILTGLLLGGTNDSESTAEEAA